MLDVFAQPPSGIQDAPHEARLSAAGHQVTLRSVKLNCATDLDTLMQEIMMGLSVEAQAVSSWETLFSELVQPEQAERLAVLLLGYRDFRARLPRLSDELDHLLLAAQDNLAQQGKQLYLLAAYPESDPSHF